MFRGQSAPSPTQVFQALLIIHYNFIAAILIYFAVGEVMAHQVDDFKSGGFVDFGTATIWAIRGVFIAMSLIELALTYTIFRDEPFIASRLSRSAEVTDSLVAASLQSAHIVRLAITQSIAIYGLDLFLFNGHRYDVYGFGLVAIVNLLLLRPSRDRWDAIFRKLAIDHPAITSSPWAPQL